MTNELIKEWNDKALIKCINQASLIRFSLFFGYFITKVTDGLTDWWTVGLTNIPVDGQILLLRCMNASENIFYSYEVEKKSILLFGQWHTWDTFLAFFGKTANFAVLQKSHYLVQNWENGWNMDRVG